MRNLDFVNACPTAGFALQSNPHQFLIFGGQSTKTFLLDTRQEVNLSALTANVVTCKANLVQQSRFATHCDVNVASINSVHYVIDGALRVLHQYKEKEQVWEGQSLHALGVNE